MYFFTALIFLLLSSELLAEPRKIKFHNSGDAAQNLYRVSQAGELHMGALPGNYTTTAIMTNVGDHWRTKLAVNSKVVFNYIVTSQSHGEIKLPGYLENAYEPSSSAINKALGVLKKNIDKINAVANQIISSTPLVRDIARVVEPTLSELVESVDRSVVEPLGNSIIEVSENTEYIVENKLPCEPLEMQCPIEGQFYRYMRWNAETLRCDPLEAIELVIEQNCDPAFYAPMEELDWWFEQARQDTGCSSAVGNQLSRFGENYPFLNDACILHDMCYRTASSKIVCDNYLGFNIAALCKNTGLSDFILDSVGICGAVLDAVYMAMRHDQAHWAFNNDQRQFCERYLDYWLRVDGQYPEIPEICLPYWPE